MPIRFRCQHCEQLLSVGSKKAGMVVSCPKCKTKVVVPTPPEPRPAAPSEAAPVESYAAVERTAPEAVAPPSPDVAAPASPAASQLAEDDEQAVAFPEFSVYDYDTEFIYEAGEDDEGPRERIDLDRVSIPRWIIYAQGVLLGVMALVGFGLGIVMGRAVPGPGESRQPVGPLTVTGEVAYDAGDHLPTPDAGAAVLLVPEDARPEQKAAVAPLLPGAGAVDASDPAVIAIRQIGGDFARADREGKFRLIAAQPGTYFLLIVSDHLDRPGGERAAPQDLAELGRYVESAPELFGQKRYQWTRRRLQENERVSHVFR